MSNIRDAHNIAYPAALWLTEDVHATGSRRNPGEMPLGDISDARELEAALHEVELAGGTTTGWYVAGEDAEGQTVRLSTMEDSGCETLSPHPPPCGAQHRRSVMIVDLSLKNATLYDGCEIEEVAGRLNLTTPVGDAVNIVGRNITAMIAAVPAAERDEVTLTGPMAVWSYLIVFHAVVHLYRRVYYDDGRGGPVLVAAHG